MGVVRKKTIIACLVLAWVVVMLDQWTKYLISSQMYVGQVKSLNSYLSLYYLRNTGAAFSFLAGMGGAQLWLFSLLSLIVAVTIVIYLFRMPADKKLQAVALALILGGAVGNLIDRIRLRYVVDFVFFHVGGWSWPAFNVADSAVCIGALIFIVDMLLHKPEQKKQQ